jgi:trehalose-phosphatase
MKYLLNPEGRAALQAHFGHSTLIALDYDGTLAPIVEDRRKAVMADATRHLLRQIAHRRPTVIISGRARAEVRSFLAGIELLEIIGNHGIEADGVPLARFAMQARDWHAELDERLETLPGLAIEDKRYSLALHYRSEARMSSTYCPSRLRTRGRRCCRSWRDTTTGAPSSLETTTRTRMYSH